MTTFTYNKPAGIYHEKLVGRYLCDVAGCDHFATWKQISGPDHKQELRWLCQMHKGMIEDEENRDQLYQGSPGLNGI